MRSGDFRTKLTYALVAVIAVASPALAAQFSASVDREEIAQDESVTLKLVVQSDQNVPTEEPTFNAPDFELIHQYQGQFVESTYINGKVGATFQRSFSYVLRPNSTGKKTISGIQVEVGSESLTASPITVQVSPGGAATAPPKNYGGSGSGLRGSGKAARNSDVFLRAEVDKNQVFKGEQIIVSYYLFTRAQSYNAQAEKFPSLGGFLKEEIEIPLIQGQMRDEIVTLDGGVYKKILIARYAAYPLKPGKLSIDPMALKVNYYSPRVGAFDDEDDIFNQFFRQVTPRSSVVKSEPIPIEVTDLPTDGRPKDFTGAVGDFSVLSAVNRYDVRANEPVSLTLKIEGRGNLSIVQAPKLDLPDGLQLYESRSQSKEGRGGVGERIFEYLLIPRKEGEFQIPAISFTSFNPATRGYVTKSSEPITIRVSPGDPNLAASAPSFPSTPTRDVPSPTQVIPKTLSLSIEEWKSGGGWMEILSKVLLVILGGVALLVFAILGLPWLRARVRVWKDQTSVQTLRTREWKKLRESAHSALQKPFSEVVNLYETLEDRVLVAVEKRYDLPVRALSRNELHDLLVGQNKMSEDQWNQMSSFLEFVETVRFAHRAGAISEDRVRNELASWIDRVEKMETNLTARS